MRIPTTLCALLLVACAKNPGSAQSGSTDAPSVAPSSEAPVANSVAPAPPVAPTGPAACKTDDDCAWGEIDKEIAQRADCMCLLGCPHLPQSKETIKRRDEQYQRYCDPHKDGAGHPCPIDDCSRPPMPACKSGQCAAR